MPGRRIDGVDRRRRIAAFGQNRFEPPRLQVLGHNEGGQERKAEPALQVVYMRAEDDTTFAGLAKETPVPDPENTLRLINGYYPRGEPPLGEWIKVIRKVEPK